LFRVFTEIWEVKFGTISLLAMVVYDLQRYHPEFGVSVVDQVLEDVKAAMEVSDASPSPFPLPVLTGAYFRPMSSSIINAGLRR
jgi:hypothetical protein